MDGGLHQLVNQVPGSWICFSLPFPALPDYSATPNAITLCGEVGEARFGRHPQKRGVNAVGLGRNVS